MALLRSDVKWGMRSFALSFLILLGTLLSAFTLGSFLGRSSWFLDLFSHFHLQYAALLGLCLVAALLLRAGLLAALLLPALLANLALLAPFFLPFTPPSPSAAEIVSETTEAAPPRTLSVMALNVYMDNEEYGTISDYLREEAADVVMLSENKPALMRALGETLGDLYPHLYDESTRGTYGLALLSRYPLEEAKSVSLGGRGRRVIEVTLAEPARITLFGVHPLPPLGSRWAARRNDEIAKIGTLVQRTTNPVVLLGDFNASPWSRPLAQLTETTALRFANLGFGIRPTWSYRSPLLSAPIDHIFVSRAWQVSSYRVGRAVGSDHLPVVAELMLP